MSKSLNNSKNLQWFRSSCYFSSTPNPKTQFLNSVSSLILYDFEYTLEVHFEIREGHFISANKPSQHRGENIILFLKNFLFLTKLFRKGYTVEGQTT